MTIGLGDKMKAYVIMKKMKHPIRDNLISAHSVCYTESQAEDKCEKLRKKPKGFTYWYEIVKCEEGFDIIELDYIDEGD
jgi:hypothetical protein